MASFMKPIPQGEYQIFLLATSRKVLKIFSLP
jgi:hypothetical protein